MHKVRILVLCLMIVALSGGLYNGFAQESEGDLIVPLGNIPLSAPDGVEAKRADVDFPHGVHFDYNCKTCHHSWTGTAEVAGCMTSGCHDQAQTVEGDEMASVRYYKEAYHTQCIDCHKEIKMTNKATESDKTILNPELLPEGPTGCNECHPKD